jgi:hypothetical protein
MTLSFDSWKSSSSETPYGLFYKGVSFVPRRDGLVFQVVGDDDYFGFNDDTAVSDRAEAEFAVNTIAGLYKPAQTDRDDLT